MKRFLVKCPPPHLKTKEWRLSSRKSQCAPSPITSTISNNVIDPSKPSQTKPPAHPSDICFEHLVISNLRLRRRLSRVFLFHVNQSISPTVSPGLFLPQSFQLVASLHSSPSPATLSELNIKSCLSDHMPHVGPG